MESKTNISNAVWKINYGKKNLNTLDSIVT